MSTADEAYCANLHALDREYGTWAISPLHHNNRCRVCPSTWTKLNPQPSTKG